MKKRKDHQPIEESYKARMNVLGRVLDETFNDKGEPRTIGFTLLVFELGETAGGRVNYISNAERGDMLIAMKEFIARAEGRYVEDPGNG